MTEAEAGTGRRRMPRDWSALRIRAGIAALMSKAGLRARGAGAGNDAPEGTACRAGHGATAGLRPFGLGALAGALVLVASCTGDTLYEAQVAVNIAGPSVQITEPTNGQQVTSGRPVRVEILAGDTLGVSQVELTYTGVLSGTVTFDFVPPRVSVAVDTTLVMPAASGQLVLQARARNARGGVSQVTRVAVSVEPTDTVAPTVARAAVVPSRIELTDSIRVTVSARDNSGGTGIVQVGATLLVGRVTQGDTIAVSQLMNLGAPQHGIATGTFTFPPSFVAPNELPSELWVEAHGFALDSAGNCAAALTEADQRLRCSTFQGQRIGVGLAGPPEPVTVVSGRSIALPSGSIVPDMAPDVPRGRLYLSNFGRNRIEFLDLNTRVFGAPVAVGSQPWGIEMNRDADTLIVANSGGTNLSYVTLGSFPSEDVGKRVQTPNSVLFQVNYDRDANGVIRLGVTFIDFSDRPQYIAQDINGRLLYSTLPTGAAPNGTLRVGERNPGWAATEVKLLLGQQIFTPDSTTVAVAHVDSMRVFVGAGSDRIVIYDHMPGFPNTIVTSGAPRPLFDALDSLVVDPNSDITWAPGRFNLQIVGLRDTTFVAASGDRRRIAFGEGATGNGRVIMWNAITQSISNEITVADLVGNSAEHITGLDLNQDGSFNVARGLEAGYFFREDLRLQGHGPTPGQSGGGAVLHPNHPQGIGFPSGPTTVAFVAAGNSIKIFDTVHFTQRGELATRDVITGPLRVSAPLAGETGGCPGSDCIVAKLYGITSGGAVVLIDVRTRDIQ